MQLRARSLRRKNARARMALIETSIVYIVPDSRFDGAQLLFKTLCEVTYGFGASKWLQRCQ